MKFNKISLFILVIVSIGAILFSTFAINNLAVEDSGAAVANNSLGAFESFKNTYHNELVLYTAYKNEKDSLPTYNFANQNKTLGYIYLVKIINSLPLYRLKTSAGYYFYTASEDEKTNAVNNLRFVLEGIAGYVTPKKMGGDIALHRLSKNNRYILTTDTTQITTLTRQGYVNDGILGYIFKKDYSATVKSKVVASHFFYWHDCPNNNCPSDKFTYKPSNLSTYSNKNVNWYKSEFTDMVASGIDVAVAVSWGAGGTGIPGFDDRQAVPLMAQAIQDNNIKIKIAYLDDTNSVVSEWNRDQGRGYTNPTANPGIAQKMPLADNSTWSYFYDRKLKIFYQNLPKNLWATVNNISIDEGGRPLVLIYDAGRSFSGLESADDIWFAIRNSFKKDFKNTKGEAIDPFIILDQTWFTLNSDATSLTNYIDGEFIWAGENDNYEKRYTLNNFTAVTVSPGNKCVDNIAAGYCVLKARNLNMITGQQGNEASRLSSMFQKYDANNSNLILLETWNEFWEGTGINKSKEYVKNGSGYLSETYYMNEFKNLIR